MPTLEKTLNPMSAVVVAFFILFFFFQNAQAQTSPPETVYKVDWNERLAPSLGLTAHDFSLLGDSVDSQTGRLSFEHVDVSIPGNANLPVEIRRRRNPSQSYNNEFADWQLVVPTISTKIMETEFYGGKRWGKNRCTSPLISSIPVSEYMKRLDPQYGSLIYPSDYSDGVVLDVPGAVSAQVRDKTTSDGWPAAAVKTTAYGWYLTCIANIDGAGTEGFYAFAPNGDRYTFNVIRSRNAVSKSDVWLVKYDSLGGYGNYNQVAAYYDVLAASEVVDVNGNWVRYTYDSLGRLTKILSNDNRQIDIVYESSSSGRIIGITANPGTSVQQQWSYAYTGAQTTYKFVPPSTPNEVASYANVFPASTVLRTVTLPDGRQWKFSLDGLLVDAVPGASYKALPYSKYQNTVTVTCTQANQQVSLTHPDGVTGTFALEEKSRFIALVNVKQYGPPCPNAGIGQGANIYADVMAVVKKTLSSGSTPASIWEYSYINVPEGLGYNVTSIKQPDGSKTVSHFLPPSQYPKLVKEEVYPDVSSTTPIHTIDHTYIIETSGVGSTFIINVNDAHVRPLMETVTRGSDWYKTQYTYNTDRVAANYSYGYPTKIDQWSSLGGGTRTTDITYLKDADDWIFGLTDTVTKNGKLFDDYDYDTKGRLVIHKRFGATVATLAYHTTGVQAGKLNTYKDGLNRQTSFTDYYRSIPRTITRADNTTFTRAIDADGRVTQETNWRNVVTNYQYNPTGYLTLIDRPAPWTDTTIDYATNSSGLVQTITKGSDRTVNVYDPMLRVTTSLRQDLNPGGSVTATSKRYDPMGRAVFASLPKAGYPSPYGIETEFDALSRVAQVRETAPGGGTTYYEYLTGNKTQVKDPMGNITVTTASGFGSPSDGQPLKIEKPQGITTDFTYNIYGNVLTMAQAKGNGTSLLSNYLYDSRLRLCRLHMPERGDTLYAYDNADQITGYAEGQAAGSACATLPASDKVGLAYDNLGRLTTTDYPGTTPDISRTYDANGNLLTINRGGVNWTYNYNTLDLLTAETLVLDGRNYVTANAYNNDGMLTAKTYPSGRQYTYNNDGLGRTTGIGYGGANYLSGITYHPNGKINTLNRGNGGTYEQRLNDRQLTSYIGGNWGDKRNYYYDANSRITSIDSLSYNAYDRGFGYDGAGRLATATGPWGTASYQYDPLGNITKKTEGLRVVDLQYNTTNLITNVRDSAVSNNWRSYAHDARGNVIRDGRYNYSYDAANQPVTVIIPVPFGQGQTLGAYTYDGNLKRVKQIMINGETIYSIYDKSGTLVARDNVTRSERTDYISLAGQTFVRIKNGVATYPLNDHLGTAMMEADQNGSVPANQVYNYTPWGEIFNVVPFGTPGNDPGNRNEQGFTGHIDDMSGLVYMQARYYDPVIGRFLSTDPIGYADQLNLYAYVGNNPISMIDPDGKNGRLVGIAAEEIALEVAMQVVTGQPVDLVKAAKSAGEATINPLKKIERVAEVAKAAKTYYSKAQRMEKHKAVDGKCEYCGKQTQTEKPFKSDSAEGDHIKAQSKGGETSADNQANACRECNQDKSAKELGTEWQPPKPNDRIQEIIDRNNQAK